MDVILVCLNLFFLSGLIFVFWCMHCNHQTLNDCLTINKLIHSRNDWQRRSNAFSKVEYKTHFWYRVFFRDWKKLYRDVGLAEEVNSL